ncbi:MAG TPA: SRPBCC family protein [Solirubrobacteraceae bacterium]|jgi:uncharacterized protein YndB with AHSA1/START domain
MPTARRSRTIAAPIDQIWELVGDPHHLPRWWPRVTRVEDVEDDAFTEVMRTSKGKTVRADFSVVHRDEGEHALTWAQRVEGTPFARLLSAAETRLHLTSTRAGHDTDTIATEVTLELRQTLTGFFPRFGGFMVRRAAGATLEQALDGLERVSG